MARYNFYVKYQSKHLLENKLVYILPKKFYFIFLFANSLKNRAGDGIT